jgi:histidyl-tRNA synthetase
VTPTLRTEPARGMRDFLPDDVRRREYVIGVVRRVYERYGYEPLETPAVENLETLLGKYGEESNQLIFKILRRGEHEATGQADLALRYDLTVPLARVIAHHQAKLPRLFKRYQIQPVWRADRPARGRFREFYQCDVDALGSTSPAIEAEQCAAVAEVLEALGFTEFTIRLNHRRLLTALLDVAGIPSERHGSALVAVDKLDKIGREGVLAEMQARGIDPVAAAAILGRFDAWQGQAPGALLDAGLDAEGTAALEGLAAMTVLAAGTCAERHLRFDPGLARGLSYYTGAIMEIAVGDLPGSLGGGGRYDDLVGMFLGQRVPACGFSLGLERILVVMGERGMFPPALATASADVMTAVFDATDLPHAMRLAARLRSEGLRVLVYPEGDRLGRQIRYADARGIPYVAILGGDEIAAGTVTVKDLATQTQHTWDQAAAAAAIREGLTHRG